MTSVSTLSNAEILNNYISSTQSTTTTDDTTSSSLWGDFDTFLTILTTQLQNQDPTEPVDASEFTNQLVQYAEVEQQISSNDKLDEITSLLGSNGITPLLSYVGQYVETESTNELVVQNGTAMLGYTLDAEALSATLYIQDSSGNVIATISGPTDSGMNRIAWDGTLDDGTTASDGVYKYVLTVKDSAGDTVTVDDQRVIGQVSSIETDSDGNVVLKIGSLEVETDDILSVFAGVAVDDSSASTATEETTDSST